MALSDVLEKLRQLVLPSRASATSAVILAGGTGSRMEKGKPKKQLRPLFGIPVAVRTLLAFEKAETVFETVLVTCEADMDFFFDMKEKYGLKKLSRILPGGDTRLASAIAGFSAVSEKATHVALHDAARPLVLPSEIDAVVKAAYLYRAATAVMPVYDTVKELTEEGIIAKTLPRDRLALAATPQVFQVEYYRAALDYAVKEALTVTDDNMLLEAIGQAVKSVPVSRQNIKITTEPDILYAESVLKEREKR